MATIRFKHSQELLQAYLAMSFYSLTLFAAGHWWNAGGLTGQSLVLAIMLGVAWTYYQARFVISTQIHDLEVSLYVLTQAIGHLLCAHIFGDLGGYFLFFTHGLMGVLLFYFSDDSTLEEKIPKGVVPMVVGMMMAVGLQGKFPILSINHMPSIFSFVILSFGLVAWGANITQRYVRSAIWGHRRRSNKGLSVLNEEEKSKLFFHDLINQTHNVQLFLEHTHTMKNLIGLHDIELLQSEIKLMQSMIQEHFGHHHRHGYNCDTWRPFADIQEQFFKMASNYLQGPIQHWSLSLQGDLDPTVVESKRRDILVHAPYLYRIVNNMIKNAAESGRGEIQVIFTCENKELKVIVKNKILHLREAREDLAKKLEKVIMDIKSPSLENRQELSGLGMESMASLSEELMGHFSFNLDGDYWTTMVVLPIRLASEKNVTAETNLPMAA